MQLFQKSVRILPVFAGLFLLQRPAEAVDLELRLKNLLLLAFLVLGLMILLETALKPRELPHWLKKKKGQAGPKQSPGLLFYIGLACSCLLIVMSFQLLRITLPPPLFYTLLALAVCKGLEVRSRVTQHPIREIVFGFIFDVGMGLMSFQLLLAPFPAGMPQAVIVRISGLILQTGLLLSCGFALMNAAVSAARHLEEIYHAHRLASKAINRRRKPAPPRASRWRRLHAGLTLLGPSCMGLAAARGLLPLQYQLVLLSILPAIPMLRLQHAGEKAGELPAHFSRQAAGLCLLFAAMVLLAGGL